VRLWRRIRGRPCPVEVTYRFHYRPGGHLAEADPADPEGGEHV
jgi:hypothetical protein